MSTTRSVKTYDALSAEQKEIIANKRAEAERTPAAWCVMLGELAAFDEVGDAGRKRAGWGCGISILLTIVLLIVFAPLAALTVIATIVFAVMFFRLKKRDIPNSLRESLLPLVVVLREDMESDASLSLRFDLREPTRRENVKRENKGAGGYPRVEESFYENAWMSGSGALADGTTLEWSVTDGIRERKVTKRNPRGKIKTKTKYKVLRMLEMRVALRTDAYALQPANVPQGALRMATKEGEKRNVVKLRRRMISTGAPFPTFDVRDFIDTLAGAYRRVALVKQEGE